MSPDLIPQYMRNASIILSDDLLNEEKYWSLDSSIVLAEETANELIQSIDEHYAYPHFETNSFGFNPKLKGALKGHAIRVSVLSLFLHEELERKKSGLVGDRRVLARAALNHDIGKMVPEIYSIVMSNEHISRAGDKWEVIKKHPEKGSEAIMDMYQPLHPARIQIADAVKYHHERPDGKGYFGLKLKDIPPESQIITVADAIDVMSGGRPFSIKKGIEDILQELLKCDGQFSREIVEAVFALKPKSDSFIDHLKAS